MVCRVCNGNCDPGDIQNGVCFDCNLEEIHRNNIKKKMDNMVRSTDYQQIKLEEIISENHKN